MTWKATRTKKSLESSASRPVARNPSCSRRARSFAGCLRTWWMDSNRTQVLNMLHLSSERLAELADGEPTIAEAEHLAACAICATERSAHQRLLTLAGDERDRIAPPLTNWASLSARLRELEIIVTPVPATAEAPTSLVPLVSPRPRRRVLLAGLRVAAGIVFAL